MAAYFGTLIFSSAIALVISQKLAGPIVRLRGYFQNLQPDPAGEIEKISFRDADFFSDLPGLINDSLTHVIKNQKPR